MESYSASTPYALHDSEVVIRLAAGSHAIEVPLQSAGDWTIGARAISHHATPPTFEELGHDSALVRYECDLPNEAFEGASVQVLRFDEVRDQAWVSIDGTRVGSISRTRHEASLAVPTGNRLSLLVEEQGRVNYASRIGEHKGLIGRPYLGDVQLTEWTVTAIDVAAIGEALSAADPNLWTVPASTSAGPVALQGAFWLDQPSDLFLDTTGWSRGFAFVNGFFLGRYRPDGPQSTLYVPGPIVLEGENVLLVLELEHLVHTSASFVAAPNLGGSEE